jgi:hypothetical protein
VALVLFFVSVVGGKYTCSLISGGEAWKWIDWETYLLHITFKEKILVLKFPWSLSNALNQLSGFICVIC